MDDECYVMLLHDEEGHPSVLVSDAPDAACTVGASDLRTFAMAEGWPQDARDYADELSRKNNGAAIEYEWWAMRDFGNEGTDDDYISPW